LSTFRRCSLRLEDKSQVGIFFIGVSSEGCIMHCCIIVERFPTSACASRQAPCVSCWIAFIIIWPAALCRTSSCGCSLAACGRCHLALSRWGRLVGFLTVVLSLGNGCIDFHQNPVSVQACNLLGLHWSFCVPLCWRSGIYIYILYCVLETLCVVCWRSGIYNTKMAHIPLSMWGVVSPIWAVLLFLAAMPRQMSGSINTISALLVQ